MTSPQRYHRTGDRGSGALPFTGPWARPAGTATGCAGNRRASATPTAVPVGVRRRNTGRRCDQARSSASPNSRSTRLFRRFASTCPTASSTATGQSTAPAAARSPAPARKANSSGGGRATFPSTGSVSCVLLRRATVRAAAPVPAGLLRSCRSAASPPPRPVSVRVPVRFGLAGARAPDRVEAVLPVRPRPVFTVVDTALLLIGPPRRPDLGGGPDRHLSRPYPRLAGAYPRVCRWTSCGN